eukprot:3893511-Amphidinium_carterae.1
MKACTTSAVGGEVQFLLLPETSLRGAFGRGWGSFHGDKVDAPGVVGWDANLAFFHEVEQATSVESNP